MALFGLFGSKKKKGNLSKPLGAIRKSTLFDQEGEDYSTVLGDILGEPEVEAPPPGLLSDIIPPTLENTPQRSDGDIQEAARSAMLKERKRKGRGATILNTASGLPGSPASVSRPALRRASVLGA